MQPVRKYQHVFGPVPSRRFGRSLGIDLLPTKTCSFDCVFCQLGPTAAHTLDRREYVPVADVLDELGDWLRRGGQADYITLSGSGEPTLHSHFGEVLDFVRDNTPIPSLLLTNGTLLRHEEVRHDAARASVVKVPLSAWNDQSFHAINRPCEYIRLDDLLESYRLFRKAFKGRLWLEVFLVDGMNDSPSQVRKIAALAAAFRPDRIHLNTAIRPPAQASVKPVPQDRMQTFVGFFDPVAEVAADFSTSHNGAGRVDDQVVLDMLRRHPATKNDLAAALHAGGQDMGDILRVLVSRGLIRSEAHGGDVYYLATDTPPPRKK